MTRRPYGSRAATHPTRARRAANLAQRELTMVRLGIPCRDEAKIKQLQNEVGDEVRRVVQVRAPELLPTFDRRFRAALENSLWWWVVRVNNTIQYWLDDLAIELPERRNPAFRPQNGREPISSRVTRVDG